ncbi:hypothetical protein RM863_11675 [Streptomyces sp. DSM 41014]|uniref:Tail assembly chaperone n=1 Tax=Streptomyces hintoniae TaxID=3075521 RepID=A0ABU2UI13_9ACTN|nr:hypothetical protein [Streptomyces sp. DSM 41014]MDT0472785.1 hypothetical protein [Streptomyces sp. DSM 41014]
MSTNAQAVSLRIDPDVLTIGDLEDFEDVVGAPLYDVLQAKPVRDSEGRKVLDDDGRPELQTQIPTKALKALIWITQRNENPDFSLQDARNVRVSALELVAGDGQGNDESGD